MAWPQIPPSHDSVCSQDDMLTKRLKMRAVLSSQRSLSQSCLATCTKPGFLRSVRQSRNAHISTLSCASAVTRQLPQGCSALCKVDQTLDRIVCDVNHTLRIVYSTCTEAVQALGVHGAHRASGSSETKESSTPCGQDGGGHD